MTTAARREVETDLSPASFCQADAGQAKGHVTGKPMTDDGWLQSCTSWIDATMMVPAARSFFAFLLATATISSVEAFMPQSTAPRPAFFVISKSRREPSRYLVFSGRHQGGFAREKSGREGLRASEEDNESTTATIESDSPPRKGPLAKIRGVFGKKHDDAPTSDPELPLPNLEDVSESDAIKTEIKDAKDDSEMTETDRLLKQVKEAGTAGVISYALWELGFWILSVPVVLFGYYEVTGHFPDLGDKEDLAKLSAEAFAFVNFARFAVPLRIGLALSTTPWIQKNIVDQFMDGGNRKESS